MVTVGNRRELLLTVCYRALPRFRGRQHIVTSALAAAGCQVTQVEDGALDLTAGRVVLLFGNANWYPAIRRQLAAKPKSERPFVVVWHAEPLPPPKAAGFPRPRLHLREITGILFRGPDATDVYTNYFRLRSLTRKGLLDVLAVTTQGGCQFLAERGISAQWVPYGYDPSHGYDRGLPRDLDVLFIGELRVPRRQRLIKTLREQGVNLLAVGSWSDPAYWEENRTRLLNRTKIMLNLQRYPGQFSGLRLILGMANKALVVSEPLYQPAPYVPGKHYVSATVEEMPQVIRYYLEHADEREAITREGYRLVTQEVTLKRSVARLLQLIESQRRYARR